ncbi:MAG: DnaJ domain-containing protein [Brevinematales bacterium]|nr:DnaJ domain-containing protein [Brevinematales bacterium]
MSENFKNYYEILDVDFGASIEEIKASFRKLAKKYHPDLNNGKDTKDFKIILEAYKILSDDKLRSNYDKEYLKRITPLKKFKNTTNIIDPSRIEYKLSLLNISKAGFDLSKKFKRKEFLEELGEDLVIYLTDKEIKEGALLAIKLPARSVCDVCYGTNRNCYRCDGTGYVTTIQEVKIHIPPNIKHSETIYVELGKIEKRKGVTKFLPNDLKIKIKWLSASDID